MQSSSERSEEQSIPTEQDVPSEEDPTADLFFMEIGELDEPPIRFQDLGWVIRQDGLYGYLSKEGELVVEPKYEMFEYLGGCDNKPVSVGILFPKGKMSIEGVYLPYDYFPDDISYGIGGTGPMTLFQLNEKNQVEDVRGYEGQSITEETLPMVVFKKGVDGDTYDSEPYWIWVPQTDELYGPYESAEEPSFMLSALHDDSKNVPLYELNCHVGWTFWMHEGSGKVLINTKLGKKTEVYDEIWPVDPMTFAALKNGKIDLYDLNLDLRYSTRLEEGATPIGPIIPVKYKGKWYLSDTSSQS